MAIELKLVKMQADKRTVHICTDEFGHNASIKCKFAKTYNYGKQNAFGLHSVASIDV